jgi:hypothetical protein
MFLAAKKLGEKPETVGQLKNLPVFYPPQAGQNIPAAVCPPQAGWTGKAEAYLRSCIGFYADSKQLFVAQTD